MAQDYELEFEKDEEEEAERWLEDHKDEIPPEIEDEIDNENVFSLEDLAEQEEAEAQAEEDSVLEDNYDSDYKVIITLYSLYAFSLYNTLNF